MRKALGVVLLTFAAATLAFGQTSSNLADRMVGARAHANVKTPVAKPRSVKVYLVAVGDDGKTGKKFGCADSLVAVKRGVPWTAAPLKAALKELVATPHEFNDKLGNYVFGPDLKLKSVSIWKGTATIRFSGAISVAGVCDQPRITEQIMATAKQFPTVKRVRVFVGDQTLQDALR